MSRQQECFFALHIQTAGVNWHSCCADYEGEEYVVLLPAEETEDAGEVVILQVEDTDLDEESYISVEDEDVLNKVFEIFKDKFKDEFNFVD